MTELLEGLSGQLGRTQLSDLLRHLIDDFYIMREAGKHDFRLEFLRQFWVEERGLCPPFVSILATAARARGARATHGWT